MILQAETILLPIGLGLLGFVETCSIDATLVTVKMLEGQSAARQLVQMGLFATTRAGFIGLAGALAAGLGIALLGVLLGLNTPACAATLIFARLAAAAAKHPDNAVGQTKRVVMQTYEFSPGRQLVGMLIRN